MNHAFWKEDIEDRVKFLESIILNCAPLPPGKCTTGAYFLPYMLKKNLQRTLSVLVAIYVFTYICICSGLIIIIPLV